MAQRYKLTFFLFFVLIFVALAGPWVVPYDPLATQASVALSPPSASYWFGTDQLGRDVFSRVVVATRLDLLLAFSAVVLSASVGTWIGAMTGFVGGWTDAMNGRFVDILMAFPLFALAMLLVAAIGNSVSTVIIATALVNLPFYIRLARAEVSSRRHAAYVDAARLGGSGRLRILYRVLIPDILPLVLTQASVNMGWAILNAAGLSFLGLGVRPPTAEWGIMLAEGARFLSSGQWWLVVCPGFALAVTVLLFQQLGDILRAHYEPETAR